MDEKETVEKIKTLKQHFYLQQNENIAGQLQEQLTHPAKDQKTPDTAQSPQLNFNQVSNQNEGLQIAKESKKKQNIALRQRVRISGQGQFGKVEIYVDYQTGQLHAVKKFKGPKYYKDEKAIYENLENDFQDQKQQLSDLAILPSEYNDTEQTILFLLGECSLQQLLDQHDFVLSADQAVHVFVNLLKFIMLIKKQGYCHSDIKPDNTQLVRCEGVENAYQLKLIDFGALSKNELKCKSFTPAFFNSPMREYDHFGTIKFNSMDERLQNEFYTVIRTIQYSLIGKKDQKYFSLEHHRNKESRLEKLKDIQQFINKKYQEVDQSHLLHTILNFITSKGLEELYNFQELEELLSNLQSNLTEQQKYFYDTQNAIQTYINKQNIKIKQRADPLALLLGLNSFINQMGSYSEEYREPKDLLSELQAKLFESTKNIVVIGASGAGKTLLLIKLLKNLQEINLDFDMALVNLRDLSNQNQMISQQLYIKIEQQISKQSKNQQLIILLDGYDELNNKEIKLSTVINDRYKQSYEKINILVTTRPNYATDVELDQVFEKPLKLYICPFEKVQTNAYIMKFLENYQKYKIYLDQYEILDKVDDYLEIINQSGSLDQLCTIPFTLSLVIFMIPIYKKKLMEQEKQKLLIYTKYNIYDIFVKDYCTKRVDKLFQDDVKRLDMCQMYKQKDFQSKLLQDITVFNYKCSWSMLGQLRLQLTKADLHTIFQEIQALYDNKLKDISDIIQEISPTAVNNKGVFSYLHKSFYEFYIAQSIIEETLNAKCQAIDEQKTIINTAFLRFDLDILSLVSEHIMEMPLAIQYLLFFETWYKSVLLTRKIKTEKIDDKDIISKLEKIGSNCVNLLAGSYRCDLTYRDFSDCAIPHAYFYKRDLTGCKKVFIYLKIKIV